MVGQPLTSGMDNSYQAKGAAKMCRVGGDGPQWLGNAIAQDWIDAWLVLPGNRCDLGRDGEHNVEIGHGQEVRLAVCEPLVAGSALTFAPD